MDEGVLAAIVLSTASLATAFITTAALWRVRKTEAIAKLVEAHRRIAEDAVAAYERLKEQQTPDAGDSIAGKLDYITEEIGRLSRHVTPG